MEKLLRHRLLGVIAGFLLGVAVAEFLSIRFLFTVFLVALVVVIFFVLKKQKQNAIAFALIMLGCVLGVVRVQSLEPVRVLEVDQLLGSEVTIEGSVVAEPDVREESVKYVLEVKKINEELREIRVLVTLPHSPELSYGDSVVLTGALELPESFITDTGREFDYEAYVAVGGIGYLMYNPSVEKITAPSSYSLLGALYSTKHYFMGSLEKLFFEPQVSLAEGLLLGVKRALGDELLEAFRRAGVIHIVVLSGYNVALVVTFVMRLLRPFPQLITTILAAIGVLLFVFMVGAEPPVLRAGVMALVVLVAEITGKRTLAFHSLAVAVFILILISPRSLLGSLSFQLSVLATLGIIFLSPVVERKLWFLTEKLSFRSIIAATLATQLSVLPLLVFSIGEVSLVAPFANAIILPLVPFAMLGAFLAGTVGFVSGAAALPLAWLTTLILDFIINVSVFFGNMRLATVVLPVELSAVLSIVIAVAVVAVTFFQQKSLRPKQTSSIPPLQS